MNVLGSRMLSRGAMERRLRELGETDDDAAATADWLVRIGLIDDAEFARELVRGCVRRGLGIRRIHMELHKRLVPRELWDDALEEIEDDAAQRAAVQFIEKKLRGAAVSPDERRRVSDALARRGFKWDEIRAAWTEYESGLDDNENASD
jgi:regulatory protein